MPRSLLPVALTLLTTLPLIISSGPGPPAAPLDWAVARPVVELRRIHHGATEGTERSGVGERSRVQRAVLLRASQEGTTG